MELQILIYGEKLLNKICKSLINESAMKAFEEYQV